MRDKDNELTAVIARVEARRKAAEAERLAAERDYDNFRRELKKIRDAARTLWVEKRLLLKSAIETLNAKLQEANSSVSFSFSGGKTTGRQFHGEITMKDGPTVATATITGPLDGDPVIIVVRGIDDHAGWSTQLDQIDYDFWIDVLIDIYEKGPGEGERRGP